MTSEQIANCIDNFLNANARDYKGGAYPDGFIIAEKYVKYIGRVGVFSLGRIKNSFAPLIKAKVISDGEKNLVTGTVRMSMLSQIVTSFIYWVSLITLVYSPIPFLLMTLFLHFAYFKPLKKLKRSLEDIL